MFKRNLNRSIAGNIFLFIILLGMGLFTALPFIYCVSNAFKPLDQLFIFPPPLFVTHPTFDNFIQLGQICTNFYVPFSRYAFNSIIICVLAIGGHVVIGSMAAYVLSKHQFPGKKVITQTVVITLLFGTQVTYLPLYIVMTKMGIINTYFSMILPQLPFPLGLYLMMNFMGQINDSMMEAARIDGASEMKIFWRIVMPNCKPAIMTVIILLFVQVWKDPGSIYIFDEQLKVLPSILMSVAANIAQIANAGASYAAVLAVSIPPAIIFLLSEGLVVETMSTSGLKE